MTIKFGNKRGEIDSSGHLKVLLDNEGVFIKVIAIHKSNKKVIGILENNLFGGSLFKWGDMLEFYESDPNEITKFSRRVNSVPNTSDWRILEGKEKYSRAKHNKFGKDNWGGVF